VIKGGREEAKEGLVEIGHARMISRKGKYVDLGVGREPIRLAEKSV
jgi:hypothetical protein